jgi:O-acetylserine/cysteine efflux transporter
MEKCAVCAASPISTTLRWCQRAQRTVVKFTHRELLPMISCPPSASPDPAAPRSARPDPAAPRSAGPDPAAPRSAGPDPATPPTAGRDPAAPPRLRAACTLPVLASGAIGYGGSVLVQNAAITRTSVTHAALLIGAAPVLVAVIAALWHHTVARPVAWAGFAVSLVGVGLVAGGRGGGATAAGDALVLASLLLSATFTVAQARILPGRDPVAVTAVQFIGAALAVLPFAVITEGMPAAPGGPRAVFAVASLAAVGTLLPFTLFAYGQSRVSPEVAGAFLNLEPLVGAVAGAVIFGDPAGPALVTGGAAIIVGIALSSLPLLGAKPASRPGSGRPGLVHAHGDDEPGRGGERRDHPDGREDAERVGDPAGEQRADGEPAVAPQAVDPYRPSPPRRVRDVADDGQQRWVDHRGAGAEQHRGDRSGGERRAKSDQADRAGPARSVRAAAPTSRDPPVNTPSTCSPSSSRQAACSAVWPGVAQARRVRPPRSTSSPSARPR